MATFLIKHDDGRIDGPITAAEVRARIRSGEITGSTLIRQEGRTSWHAAGMVPGLAALFAEVAATRDDPAAAPEHAAPAPDEAPPIAGPVAGFAASPAPAVATAANPAPRPASAGVAARPGLGDRILRGAFQFARSISVLVIISSSLVAAGGCALAVYAFLPSPPSLSSGSVDKPTLAEFIDECARPSQAPSQPRQATKPPRSRGRALETNDDCGPFRERAEMIIARLKLDQSAVEVLCSRIAALAAMHREAFIDGLDALSMEFESNPPKGEDCTGADAANWYMREFFSRIELEEAKEAASAAAAAARRSLMVPALTAIAYAIAALLMFLILPLLIQIERNTRTA